MELKAFVLTHSEGEYDNYSESVDYVLLGPAELRLDRLQKEFYDVLCKFNSKKPHERMLRNTKNFCDWLIKEKGFQLLEFDQGDPF